MLKPSALSEVKEILEAIRKDCEEMEQQCPEIWETSGTDSIREHLIRLEELIQTE